MSCVGCVSGCVAGLCQPPLPTTISTMHNLNRGTKLLQAFADHHCIGCMIFDKTENRRIWRLLRMTRIHYSHLVANQALCLRLAAIRLFFRIHAFFLHFLIILAVRIAEQGSGGTRAVELFSILSLKCFLKFLKPRSCNKQTGHGVSRRSMSQTVTCECVACGKCLFCSAAGTNLCWHLRHSRPRDPM